MTNNLMTMEWFTIILTGLLTAIAPAGLILDNVVENTLRQQVKKIEQIEVRFDNTPSYQILEGKVDRVRIASRGVEPIANLRIEAIELETDPINANLDRLQQGGKEALIESLRQPFQAGIRVVIKEADINKALAAPNIKAQIQQLIDNLLPKGEDNPIQKIEFISSQVQFIDNNRLRVQSQVQIYRNDDKPPESIDLIIEVGLNIIAGRSLQFVEPTGTLNGRKLSSRLLKGFAENFSSKLDLRELEKQGLTIRILQFKLEQNQINLAAFLRVEPRQPASQIKK
jgi:hypothetical protein